jgi:hypothetical protein
MPSVTENQTKYKLRKRTREAKECSFCGVLYKTYPTLNSIFCSPLCKIIAKRKILCKRGHLSVKSNKHGKSCKQCTALTGERYKLTAKFGDFAEVALFRRKIKKEARKLWKE